MSITVKPNDVVVVVVPVVEVDVVPAVDVVAVHPEVVDEPKVIALNSVTTASVRLQRVVLMLTAPH